MKIESRHFQAIFCLVCLTSVLLGQDQAAAQQQNGGQQEAHHDEQQNQQKRDPMKLVKDSQHIKEHLKTEYGFTDEQAENYLKQYDAQTQFFVMHDYDNNTKLDGLELLKSMTHHHDEDGSNGENHDNTDQTETLVEFVDMVMKDQDLNDDGYIDYPEYISYYTKFDKDQVAPTTAGEAPQAPAPTS